MKVARESLLQLWLELSHFRTRGKAQEAISSSFARKDRKSEQFPLGHPLWGGTDIMKGVQLL